MKEISAEQLKQRIDNQESLQVIDIREEYEFEDGAICNTNIPMGEFLDRLNEMSAEDDVVLYCQTGKRASALVYTLQERFQRNNFLNLTGGYEAFLSL